MTNGTYRRSVTIRVSARNLPLNAVGYENVNVTGGPQQSVITGTGDGTGDVFIFTNRTIPALSASTFDLFSGDDFNDVFDQPAPLRVVREISIWIVSGDDGSGVRIGGATAGDVWPATFSDDTDMVTIYPGGGDWTASNPVGILVTNLQKNLQVENLGNADVNIRIAIAGSTAVAGVPMYLANLLMTYP